MVSRRRLVSATGMGLLALASILFDPLFVMVVVVLIALGLFEFFSMLEKKGIPIYKYFGITIGVIIPLSIFLRFELTRGWEFLFISLALGTLFVLQFSRRQSSNAVIAISSTMFALFYIAWFFSFMIKLKILPYGTALVGFLLLVTKGADIGAFFVGRRFGRHALIPHISPKKTVEGAVGGLLGGMVTALACDFLILKGASPIGSICAGAGINIMNQFGDLGESVLKRAFGIKDSGGVFPGHGGVLDRLDSLLFAAPFFYFWVTMVFPE